MDLVKEGFTKQLPGRCSQEFHPDLGLLLIPAVLSVCPLGISLFVLSEPLMLSLPLLLLSVERTVKLVEVALQPRFCVLSCGIKPAKRKEE